jgi:two-component system cell cycle sensor histidine kinase/response regulator CckA
MSEAALAPGGVSAALLRDLLEAVDEGVWCASADDGGLRYLNRAVAEIYGRTRADLLGTPGLLSQALHPDDRERAERAWRELGGQGRATCEVRILRPDREERAARMRLSVLRDGTGAAVSVVGIVRDITETRQADAWLASSVSLLEAALDSTADGILVVDREGRFNRFNAQFVEMWRLPEEIVEEGDDEKALAYAVGQLKDPRTFYEKVQALYSHPEEESFDVLEFRDGRIFERYSRPQRIGDAVVGRVWCFRDVTQRTRAEEDLRQRQKMEAIGRLAGGIAHDFNNILTVITGYSNALLAEARLSGSARQGLEEIQDASERAASFTRQLLAFGRRQQIRPETLQVAQVVAEMEHMLRRLLDERIALSFVADPTSGNVRADRAQLEMAVLNLVANASDAMPRGGMLSVGVRDAHLSADTRVGLFSVPAGDYVVLEVSDSGSGIDAETQAHVFEPFYTTKQAGRGTGLGLATVFGIVEQAGGSVTVESAPDRGSTFSLYLPRTRDERPVEAPEPAADAALRGTERILLVEDEESVRRLVAGILTESGYEVRAARNGREGLEVAERCGHAIDLVVTDVVMPGLGGAELMTRLRERRPALPVIYVSGYTSEPEPGGAALREEDHFLEKPHSPSQLLVLVRRALDRRGRRPG